VTGVKTSPRVTLRIRV